MIDVIQLNQIMRLSALHGVYVCLILIAGWLLLPASFRKAIIVFPVLGWLWSVAAMYSDHYQNRSFWGWFLDPAQEKNLTAILTSTLLACIGITAAFLVWHSRRGRPRWHMVYFALIGILFFFLSIDEYTSIHETFIYWRQSYLGLGVVTALLSLLFLIRNEKQVRLPMLLFVVGLGSLGFAGVMLDTFSNQQILDIGALRLDFFVCGQAAWGIRCRNYGYTEEMFELVGAAMMWLGLLGTLVHIANEQGRSSRRIIIRFGIGWLVALVTWLWILPFIENQFSQKIAVYYDDVSITGYTISQQQLQRNSTLDVTLYLSANHNLQEDYSLSVHLYTQPDADSITQADMTLGEFDYPSRAWIPGVPVRNRFHLEIPQDVAANASYQVVAMLWKDDPMHSFPANENDHASLLNGQIIILDSLPLLADDVPPSPNNVQYRFDAGFALTGFDLPEVAQAGDVITARFWWQTEQALDVSLTHFIHAINNETGDLIVFDHIPFDGRFPTQDWPAEIQIMDTWQIALDDTLPAGTYHLMTGLYDSFSIERAAIIDADGNPVQDALIPLGELVIQ